MSYQNVHVSPDKILRACYTEDTITAGARGSERTNVNNSHDIFWMNIWHTKIMTTVSFIPYRSVPVGTGANKKRGNRCVTLSEQLQLRAETLEENLSTFF